MGIPVRKLICASNANNVLTGFIRRGAYNLSGHTLQHTVSPAIDILQSSNLERLIFHLSGENPKTVREFYSRLHREGVAAAPKDVGVSGGGGGGGEEGRGGGWVGEGCLQDVSTDVWCMCTKM